MPPSASTNLPVCFRWRRVKAPFHGRTGCFRPDCAGWRRNDRDEGLLGAFGGCLDGAGPPFPCRRRSRLPAPPGCWIAPRGGQAPSPGPWRARRGNDVVEADGRGAGRTILAATGAAVELSAFPMAVPMRSTETGLTTKSKAPARMALTTVSMRPGWSRRSPECRRLLVERLQEGHAVHFRHHQVEDDDLDVVAMALQLSRPSCRSRARWATWPDARPRS